MRLLFISLALLAIASCRSGDNALNRNVAPSSNGNSEISSVSTKTIAPCVNLNIATLEDLIKLPGVGDVIARRIIDYRGTHGRFRRPEEIIIIEGFSEKKYQAIADMVCVE